MHHVIKIAETQPQVTVRVFPLVTGMVSSLVPGGLFFLYTFPGPADPMMALTETVSADHVHIEADQVARLCEGTST
ncbi:Scr1 family TA system antitoxin-like transcriptional regulator [Actinoallomurus purpureus]|uniref:Scr1 family TA system antitoxin-like transcriptional regulator n=1 Tax=Actinoallomurus purpureus TaxID=478114 RepID=UPI0035567AD2